MPDSPGQIALTQEPTKHYTPEQRAAVKHWAIWTGGLILGAIVVIGLVLVVLDRQRRLLFRGGKRRKRRRAVPDAWTESGKRMDAATIAARGDTADIDPDDLGPHDVEGDDERDPHGEGPHR